MSRSVEFTPSAWADYLYWHEQDKKTLKRINRLLEEVRRNPLNGIGKPEQLLGDMSGFWSRRIDEQNRLIYAADDVAVSIISCRKHYGDK